MIMIEAPFKYSKTTEYVVPPTAYCPGCCYGLSLRYFLKAIGPKVIIVSLPGCWQGPNLRYNGKPFEVAGTLLGNAASFCGGLSSALEAQGDTETVVVPWAGDGATFDIGLGALSGAAERNENMLYVCLDNEAYQNTGDHRSSASPWMSTNVLNLPGAPKAQFKKDIDAIMAVHRIPYLATVTVGFPEDFMRKVVKAKSIKGFRFLHILSPCPSGWGFPTQKSLELSRLAVETKVFPLMEIEDGVRYTINHKPKGLPLSSYFESQSRFRDINAEDLARFEREAEERWQRLRFIASYYKDSD